MPHTPSNPHKARIVIRFTDDAISHADLANAATAAGGAAAAKKLLDGAFHHATLRPAFQPGELAMARKLVERATAEDPAYKPVDFSRYFYLEPPTTKDLDAIVEQLKEMATVAAAYVHRVGAPPVHPSESWDDPAEDWASAQYVAPAPLGIDAEYAWRFDGDGSGRTFADVELGWHFQHNDLPAPSNNTLLCGQNSEVESERSHGTSVLGIVCAVEDNDKFNRGVAPNVTKVHVASYSDIAVAAAITCAAAALGAGDVLLIEIQVYATLNQLGPVDSYELERNAVHTATAAGVTVVEAGGNGTAVTNSSGDVIDYQAPALDLDTALTFADSGAIIVSAASAAADHVRLEYAPYGNRVDCYAWGESVFAPTCGKSLLNGTVAWTSDHTTAFSGTSSAAAIVAGAAIAIQSAAVSRQGAALLPSDVRAMLRNKATGTPVWFNSSALNANAPPSGVMPNLRTIFKDDLAVVPDVYVRDHIGDTGHPHNGPISSSPDIIVQSTPVTVVGGPTATYGEGSGTENDTTLGSSVESGQDNYIYVRMKNRGGFDASAVTATVYWSEVSTLPLPNDWTLIGSVLVPTVPSGDQLVVSDAITWPKQQLPPKGQHFCFVCVLDAEGDRDPGVATVTDWNTFKDLIRNENNLTWRNFNVVDNVPDMQLPMAMAPFGKRKYRALPFKVAGAMDEARPMALEIHARLPRGSKVVLEVPPAFQRLVRTRQEPFSRRCQLQRLLTQHLGSKVASCDQRYLPVNPHRATYLGPLALPARHGIPCRLLVHIPKKVRQQSYHIHVRQLHHSEEVGRVSWRLTPPTKPRP